MELISAFNSLPTTEKRENELKMWLPAVGAAVVLTGMVLENMHLIKT
jgi:hypothetical protein